MSMKEYSKSKEVFTLRDPMTLEELRDLMVATWGDSPPSKYKYKKGLFGKSIKFDTVMQIQPTVKIKDNVITVRKVSNSTKVGIGNGPAIDFKDTKQRIAAAKEGGLKAAAFGGHDNFNKVCESIGELLQGKLA